MHPRSLALSLLLLSALLVGCGRACDRDRPYVPYAIDDGGSAGDARHDPPAATTSLADAGELVAPPDSARWVVDGRTLVAPEGFVFARGLFGDLDGDGVADAVVAVHRPDAKVLGTVLFYPGKGPSSEILSGEKDTLPDASCSSVERLSRAGKDSVFVDVSAACAGHVAFTLPREIVLFAIHKNEPRPRFAARIADAGPRLTLSVTAADRDKDGVEDITLRFGLDGGQGRSPELVVGLLDRPAGLTRDPETPEESLRAFARDLDARSTKAREASSVPADMDALRRLYRAVCPEGGGARVRPTVGAFRCGSSAALEVAQVAEIKALAGFGDPVRAVLALPRLGRSPLPTTKERIAEAERYVELAAPSKAGRVARTVTAEPDAMPREPAFAPLAFEDTGALLVVSRGGVVRVDPNGDEAPAETPAWKSSVTSPEGIRLLEAYDPCDGTSIHLTFAGPSETHDVELPVAPDLGGRCAQRGESQRVLALGSGPRGIEVLVAGQPVFAPWLGGRGEWLLRTGQLATPPGSARSPNGRFFAVPTPRGVVVRGEKAVTVRGPELGDVSFCTVDNESKRLACLRKGRALLVEF